MKVGIVSCSNGQQPEWENKINELSRCLAEMEVYSVKARRLYAKDGVFGGTARERAVDLMAFYRDETVEAIYDISGGDIANEVLGFLDYDLIAASEKTFWGYSDLTTIINAIYTKTGKASVLYQVKNLVSDSAALQQKRFCDYITEHGTELFDIRYEFLQGNEMSGIVIGGNVRCLLKLAGTPYWPDMSGKVLLLEALGGEAAQISTYFAQLSQMGVFEKIAGLLLGTFTRFEQSDTNRTVFDILTPYISDRLPVAKTMDIGHGSDARAIVIGKHASFVKKDGKKILS